MIPALIPSNATNILNTMGLRIGEATTKDITDPNGTLALSKPTVIGIVEQAQKGVKPPIKAPRTLPNAPL